MAADVTAIAAVADNGVIGLEDDLPWDSYPADLEFFKERTHGHPVILGRVTFESIRDRLGGPLPGRTNVVVSRTQHFKGEWIRTVQSPGSAIALALTLDDECYIAGGHSIYEALLPVANRLLITEIPESPSGDAVFPELGEKWHTVSREEGPNDLVFVEYQKESDFE